MTMVLVIVELEFYKHYKILFWSLSKCQAMSNRKQKKLGF